MLNIEPTNEAECVENKLNLFYKFLSRVRAQLLQKQKEAEQRRKAEEMQKLRDWVIVIPVMPYRSFFFLRFAFVRLISF